MQITVELPDDIAQHADPGREALEPAPAASPNPTARRRRLSFR
ncbi:MAG TPA: hypothetical protein VNY05_09640 [Candidatus Acidoferrales bacterium]|nr:hypothetical protein [Candidatus Acidoferrales bacterium]